MRRYRFIRPQDRELRGVAGSEDSIRVRAWRARCGIGLHILLYEREKAEDVARWLDHLHGSVDAVALVWTGEWADLDKGWTVPQEGTDARRGNPASILDGRPSGWPTTGPSQELADIAWRHGCQWVHQPLDDNLAAARNAGIDHLDQLRKKSEPGLAWAMFLDPDEWLQSDDADPMALRAMAESDRWGWLFQAANYRDDGQVPTISDSVRMSRLDDRRSMRMDGRVHEGFAASLHAFGERGIHPRWAYAPFILQHRGMAFEDARMVEKLNHYERLLRLELADRPHNPGAWVSLGWHYLNDGHVEEGLECYRRGIACAGRSYLPFKEMAYHHLREARRLMDECGARLEPGHQFHDLAQQLRQFLRQNAPPHPVLAPRDGDPAPLPDFSPPDASGESGYDRA
jgi:hypothetical protein